MTTSRWIVASCALALCGCKEHKENTPAAKQSAIDAAPTPKPPPPAAFEPVAAGEAETRPMQSPAIVLIKQDGTVFVTASPTKLDPPGMLLLDDVPAGTARALAELSTRADEILVDPARVPPPAASDAGELDLDPCLVGGYGLGVTGTGNGGGDGWGTIGLAKYQTPGSHSGRSSAGLRGRVLHGSEACVNAPLVVADARAPAARLVEVLQALPSALIGVTTDGGVHARPLRIELTYVAGNAPVGETPLEIGFVLRTAGIHGAAYRGLRSDETLWAWDGDANGLADAYHQGQAKDALVGNTWGVRLRLDGDVTAGALITAITQLVAGNVDGMGIGEPIDFVRTPRKHADAPTATLLQPTITGAYDKAILRRYLKRNFPKIRYCYEKQLLVTPALVGTITVGFTILPTGKVAGVTADGFDKTVASCISDAVVAIQFPKPDPAAEIKVTQGFEFHPTGG